MVIEAAWTLSRSRGLTGWSIRELAKAVGIKAPTLYAYFDSKDAIYDAMFHQSYEHPDAIGNPELFIDDHSPRQAFKLTVHRFFDFCTDDPIRYELMFQRTIPGFEPSAETYATSLRSYERYAQQLERVGVTDHAHLDLWTAMISGLISQQLSNDPGGDRWRRLVDMTVDLFCDHVGIPPEGEPTL